MQVMHQEDNDDVSYSNTLQQLTNYNRFDIPLMGNPEITLFRNVNAGLKRHTNFAIGMQKIKCLTGNENKYVIDRRFDLLNDIIIKIKDLKKVKCIYFDFLKYGTNDLPKCKKITDDEFFKIKSHDLCGICQEELNTKNHNINNLISITNCNHIFHKQCIFPWVTKHPSCPTCRNDLSKFNIFMENDSGNNVTVTIDYIEIFNKFANKIMFQSYSGETTLILPLIKFIIGKINLNAFPIVVFDKITVTVNSGDCNDNVLDFQIRYVYLDSEERRMFINKCLNFFDSHNFICNNEQNYMLPHDGISNVFSWSIYNLKYNPGIICFKYDKKLKINNISVRFNDEIITIPYKILSFYKKYIGMQVKEDFDENYNILCIRINTCDVIPEILHSTFSVNFVQCNVDKYNNLCEKSTVYLLNTHNSYENKDGDTPIIMFSNSVKTHYLHREFTEFIDKSVIIEEMHHENMHIRRVIIYFTDKNNNKICADGLIKSITLQFGNYQNTYTFEQMQLNNILILKNEYKNINTITFKRGHFNNVFPVGELNAGKSFEIRVSPLTDDDLISVMHVLVFGYVTKPPP